MKGSSLTEQTHNHIAFKIAEVNFESFRQKIIELGLTIRREEPRIKGEGRSIYFYDYDNHLFEFHTGTLNERLSIYESNEN